MYRVENMKYFKYRKREKKILELMINSIEDKKCR